MHDYVEKANMSKVDRDLAPKELIPSSAADVPSAGQLSYSPRKMIPLFCGPSSQKKRGEEYKKDLTGREADGGRRRVKVLLIFIV